jgi:hypothetical protein
MPAAGRRGYKGLFMAADPLNSGALSLGESDCVLTALEQRVQRLENAVAALQERSAPEATLSQVNAFAKASEPSVQNDKARTGEPPETHTETYAERPAYQTPRLRPPWLLLDLYLDAKAMVRMFFDRRYQVAWTTRAVVIFFLVMILTSYWWFPLSWGVPVLGYYLDKIVDFILAFLVYKVLSREARRYRDRVG